MRILLKYSNLYFLRFGNKVMKSINILSVLSILLLGGCNDDEIPTINESTKYSECDSRLVSCAGSKVGEYCLFGFKWGVDQNFDETGISAEGPQTFGGIITYSFQEKNGTINTHRQINVQSESWGEILDCAQSEIREAVKEWENVANLSFQELPENSDSDIQFYVAAILQSAVGYPNYSESPCDILSGDIVFDANSSEKSCSAFHINALHEIGHALGLGHVSSQNIMETGVSKFSLNGLQSGDIAGAQQIYGEK